MELEKKELISVIIPFYNEDIYFEECLNSVLNQTYSNLEIIIINDGSDEKFLKKLYYFQKKDHEKIKILNKKNGGVSSARNYGVMESKGNYIAFIDADDVWLPTKIENQLNLLKKKKLNFIHSSYLIVDENEKFIGKFLARDLNYNQLLNSCDVGLSTVMIEANLMKRHLFQNISTKEDYVCWLSVIKEVDFLRADKTVVMIYRNKKNSLSSNFLYKLVNAFKVYNFYERKNILFSIYLTLVLSIFWIKKTYQIKFKNLEQVDYRYLQSVSDLKFKKSFILSALNMASLSNLDLFYLIHKKIIFWIDGYCAKYIIKDYQKTPGRKIIENLNLPDELDKIYLVGKKSSKQMNYLEKKFKKKINFCEVPFFKKLDEIKLFQISLNNKSVIFINIATPKQELLASNILKQNIDKELYIFCMGGGMSMVSGEEPIVPENIEKLNLEWLWRLRTNTLFRLKRLFTTSTLFIFKKLTKYYLKTSFKIFN